MWYREMVAAQSYRPLTPDTSPPPLSDSGGDFPFFARTGETSIHRDGERHYLFALPPLNETPASQRRSDQLMSDMQQRRSPPVIINTIIHHRRNYQYLHRRCHHPAQARV
jgi:hypothetical protein